MNNNARFEIIKEIGILEECESGWNKELNLVSWNGKEPQYDIREWDADHFKMSFGITLSSAAMDDLIRAADKIKRQITDDIDLKPLNGGEQEIRIKREGSSETPQFQVTSYYGKTSHSISLTPESLERLIEMAEAVKDKGIQPEAREVKSRRRKSR